MKHLKTVLLILFVILLTFVLYSEKITTIPELMGPQFLAVDDSRFYVSEGATVSIFDLKDFHLIKKFGKEGNGPKEFSTAGGRLPLFIIVQKVMRAALPML